MLVNHQQGAHRLLDLAGGEANKNLFHRRNQLFVVQQFPDRTFIEMNHREWMIKLAQFFEVRTACEKTEMRSAARVQSRMTPPLR